MFSHLLELVFFTKKRLLKKLAVVQLVNTSSLKNISLQVKISFKEFDNFLKGKKPPFSKIKSGFTLLQSVFLFLLYCVISQFYMFPCQFRILIQFFRTNLPHFNPTLAMLDDVVVSNSDQRKCFFGCTLFNCFLKRSLVLLPRTNVLINNHSTSPEPG